MTVSAGEIWLADRGDEVRRLVFVISGARFHRLAERAVVAPVLDRAPPSQGPWSVVLGDRAVAVHQLGTLPVEKLLERVDVADLESLRQVRRAVREITAAPDR